VEYTYDGNKWNNNEKQVDMDKLLNDVNNKCKKEWSQK
jgi:hypothetical protein